MKLSTAIVIAAGLLLDLSADVVHADITNIPNGYALESVWDPKTIIQDPNITNIERHKGLRFLMAPDGSSFLCIVNRASREDSAIYCPSIERDAITGKVKSISNTTDPPVSAPPYLWSFTPGPDGFDYINTGKYDLPETLEIAQAEWEFDSATGKPKNLNILNRMNIANVSREGAYGLGFSNIAKDPNDPSRPLLFAVSVVVHYCVIIFSLVHPNTSPLVSSISKKYLCNSTNGMHCV